MATTIKLKNGSGAPLAGDLVQGEPALDLTNKRLYTEDSGGTVIEVGTNPSTLTVDGNVGIGTTSPTSTASAGPTLEISGTAGGNLVLSDSNATTGQRAKYLLSQGGTLYVGHSADNGTSPVNDLVINSSGNVGIGISSLVNPLQVSVTSNTASKTSGSAFDGGAVRLDGSLGSADSEVAILGGANDGLSSGIGFARQDGSTWGTQIRFYTHGTAITTTDELTERMRIDSSGNVIIGDTSATFNNDAKNVIRAASDNYYIKPTVCASFNRTGSDGDILQFYKAGTTVGSIASDSGARLKVNSGAVAGYLAVGNTNYYAWNSTDFRGQADGAYNLGASNARFQDLYLSGGAYLGGTAAANHLDVYEEGTHTTTLTAGSGTPTIASTEDTVGYTVIGDSVFITGQLGTINCSGCSGTLSVTMPFVTKTLTDRSDFYQFVAWAGESGIAYFVLSQNGGGSSTFFVNALKTDGSYDTNVATLMAAAGTFNLNIVGGTYKKS